MTSQPLRIERDGDTLSLVGGGVLDDACIQSLADACLSVADDVRAVVLDPDPAIWRGFEGVSQAGDLFASVAGLPQPTIAVLGGSVSGGGLELALAADIRVGASSCEISFDAAAGQFPQAGGLQRLSRAIGRSRATQLVMLEGAIDAPTALDWGLINAVAEDPSAVALTLARTICARGPIAARYAKDALRHGLEMPLAQALHYETELTILLQDTADRAEGVDAFVSKRTPQFTGT